MKLPMIIVLLSLLIFTLFLPCSNRSKVNADITDYGWITVMSEDFEGDFPGRWAVTTAPGAVDAYWGKEDYNIMDYPHYYDGHYAAYCAKNGSSSVPLPGNFPANMDTRMACGPFNLSDATDAVLDFYIAGQIDNNGYLEYSVSLNGINYYGTQKTWQGGSSKISFDLKHIPTLGNVCGQPQVWVSFRFVSTIQETGIGIIVDDVILKKFIPSAPRPQIASISPEAFSGGTNTQVTITGANFGPVQGTGKVEFWRNHAPDGSTQIYYAAQVVSWSDTQIVCTAPAGISSGDIQHGLRVTSQSGGPSDNFPYEITFSCSGPKWYGDNPGVKFWISDDTDDCTGALDAIIQAMQTWNNVSDANFYFEYAGHLENVDKTDILSHEGNGLSEILWGDFGEDGGTFCYAISQDSQIIECDIYLNDYLLWSTDGSTPTDIQRVVTHELGHCLGLSDLYGTQDYDNVMAKTRRTLGSGDIAGIQWLYPGTGTRGQYHVTVINNTPNAQQVYFKSDIDADFTRSFTVPAGQAVNSWWEVVPAGSHIVSIRWTDPISGVTQTLDSSALDVPIEGDAAYSFTISTGTQPPQNQPPALNPIGEKMVTAGQLLQFIVSATEPDAGDTLIYSASSLPAGASFDALTRTFTWTPGAAGVYSGIHFEVSDGKSTDSENITITVNLVPEVTPTPTTPPASGGGGGGSAGGASAAIDKVIFGFGTLIDDAGFVYDNIEVQSFDALATLKIPFGTTALNKAGSALRLFAITNVKEPDPTQNGTTLIGNVYDFQPSGATFDPPIPLTIMYYEPYFPQGITEDMLCIALWDEETKTYTPVDFTIDKEKNTITVYITHFSCYTILAIPKPALPLVEKIPDAQPPTLEENPAANPVETPVPTAENPAVIFPPTSLPSVTAGILAVTASPAADTSQEKETIIPPSTTATPAETKATPDNTKGALTFIIAIGLLLAGVAAIGAIIRKTIRY